MTISEQELGDMYRRALSEMALDLEIPERQGRRRRWQAWIERATVGGVLVAVAATMTFAVALGHLPSRAAHQSGGRRKPR